MTQAELVAKVQVLTSTVVKVKGEVVKLKEAIENGPEVSPEVEEALASLESALGEVDDLNEDAPEEEV